MIRGEIQIGSDFMEIELTELQNFALNQEYVVNGVPVTVKHFERIAGQMNYSRFANQPTQSRDKPLPLHGKMPALDRLLVNCYKEGIETVGCFASHGSNWTLGVPILGALNGLSRAIIVYATNPRAPKYPDWLQVAEAHGAELKPIRPNMTSINSSQAKTYVQEQGGYFIPFGLETPQVVEYLTETMAFPDNIGTLVLCAGSGITLVGVLKHLQKYQKRIQKIIAVSSGRPAKSIMDTIERHISLDDLFKLAPYEIDNAWLEIQEGYTYSQILKIETPWETHPYYERKAAHYLLKHIHEMTQPIYFLNMGV